MKIITFTLLLSLGIMPTARGDTPSDFCASLAFVIEVYEGLDQARARYERTSTRRLPRRTRGTADRNQEPAESGLAARPSGSCRSRVHWSRARLDAPDFPMLEPAAGDPVADRGPEPAGSTDPGEATGSRDARCLLCSAELQRYEKYRREAEMSRNSLEAARASFSNWCGPDSPSLESTGPQFRQPVPIQIRTDEPESYTAHTVPDARGNQRVPKDRPSDLSPGRGR